MTKLKKAQALSKLGGHIEIKQIEILTPKRLIDVIYGLTHKRPKGKRSVAIFVAGGVAIDAKLEQANRSVAKQAKLTYKNNGK